MDQWVKKANCWMNVHTIERFNSRQLSDPVFVLANDVTEVADIKSIVLVLQCFNQNKS